MDPDQRIGVVSAAIGLGLVVAVGVLRFAHFIAYHARSTGALR